MAEGGPSGPNIAMLASMEQHSNHHPGHGAGIGGGGQGLATTVGGESTLDQTFKSSSIHFGEFGSIDTLASGIGGSLEQNPFETAFSQSMSPCGVSYPDWAKTGFVGSVELSHVGPKEQLNAGPGLPGFAPSMTHGQSH
ncbi:MAG: hypothetical protein A2887_03585 [Alphaproteobacteria bacterium RIFCSPLOWO2_01_FULL_40_26]|nr:MAG: hypothetical protein A3D15_04740 [Alphaproteobacteria bacterium RIFCSPHIGHO2_02_FULL_40_34]OFW88973.1 MAG: hypothetical protein A2794_02150 [Alphaproteobacteria bacterium RIFCSPHIGHO2_01_FULL_40_8]OFW95281.1 MAG: hypothetical protein A2887_03585 [Alphaproteobacteria bacterium RIFCSPLOWO2_01_FULL_40_26]OFX09184.1 MAG: hypothetical protein A3H30_06290 [Alphaproteobacteria bacterium RIFCSPLOWO2_02_FULL_40_19]OFX11540.1 MAG: hypothetical protein A3G22_04895 [Alphaproteobacteria bacterium RI